MLTIADVTTTHLAFASGINAHVFVSWLNPFKEQKLVVVGERGMAVFDDTQAWADKLLLYPHEVAWEGDVPTPRKAEPERLEVPQGEPLKNECGHFLHSIAEGTPPSTDGHEGLRVLRVLDAAQRAMDNGHWVAPGRSVAAQPPGPPPDAFIHETASIDHDVAIGAGTRVWHHAHVLPESRIGDNCVLGQNVAVGPAVAVGDGCKIQNNVSLYKGVTLEEEVFCGPSCVFTNVLTPRAGIERKAEFRSTLVRRGATIGANATILCGLTLGRYSFVAAGAVVTHDVPAHALVGGNPARFMGWVSHAGEPLGEDLVCPRTGRRYQVTGDGTLEEMTTTYSA